MSLIKITNTEFVRDMDSQAVLNTDTTGLQNFNRTRAKLLEEKKDRTEGKERIRQLEIGMEEIRQLLRELTAMRTR